MPMRMHPGWAEFAGSERMCASIIGPSHVALELWNRLAERWGSSWSEVRDVRPHQPVLAISSPPAIPIDRRVRRVTVDQWDAYTEAAVKMYTEEIGVSPVQGNPAGYRFYVRQLISSGRAFGIFEGNRVLFKADLGSVSGSVCPGSGVWLEPELRGRGLAAPPWRLSSSWRVPSCPPCRSTSTTTTCRRVPRVRPGGLHTGWRVRDGPLLKTRTAWLAALGIGLSVMVSGCTANEPAARTPAPPPPPSAAATSNSPTSVPPHLLNPRSECLPSRSGPASRW